MEEMEKRDRFLMKLMRTVLGFWDWGKALQKEKIWKMIVVRAI